MQAQLVSQHIELQELGFNFDIPNGWTGQVDGDYILLGHQSIPGLLILSANTSKNVAALKEFAEQGVADENVQLSAEGSFLVKNNNRVEGIYKGTFNGQQVKGFAIGLINGLGKGINILILTETTKFTEQHKIEANKLASSVKFYKAKDTETTIRWKNKLMGQQLYYGLTRGDGSNVIKIDLCRDGSFYFYSNSHIAFDESYGSGSANSNKNNSGVYKIYTVGNTSVLELTFSNGEIVEYDLTTNEAGNTFLDNSRYYVRDSEYCN